MAFLHNRPLATACLLFLASLTIASQTSTATKLCLFAVLVFFVLLLPFLRGRLRSFIGKPRYLAVLLSVAALTQLFGIFVYDMPLRRAKEWEGDAVTATGYIEDISYTTDSGASFLLYAKTVDGVWADLRLSVTVNASAEGLVIGDRLTVCGRLTALDDARSGGDEKYLLADGAAASLSTDTSPIMEPGGRADLRLRHELSLLRDRLRARIRSATEGEAGDLLSAMLLGTREELSDTVTRDFRRLGLSHVLALSGLHLNILLVLLHALSMRLRVGRRGELLLSLLLIAFYALMTGLSPSILRAGIMGAAISLSFFAARPADSVTSLFAAATLILLFSPAAIYDASFWLSFSATLGILVYGEYRNARDTARGLRRAASSLLSNFMVGLSSFAATLAVIALFFGEVSVVAPLSNLLFLPFFSLYLTLAPAVLLFGNFLSLGSGVSLLGNAILLFLEKCAAAPGLLQDIRYPGLTHFLLLGTLLLLFYLAFFRTNARRLLVAVSAFLGIATMILAVYALPLHSQSTLAYRSSSSGDLILVAEGNRTLLYDATGGGYDVTEEVEDLLRLTHKTELSVYMLSHYHARHPESLNRLLGRTDIRALYLPTPESKSEESLYRDLCRIAEREALSVYLYSPHESIAFFGLSLEAHKKGEVADSAHKTLGLTIRANETTITYLGRASHESDSKRTASSAVAISDILIFGTHGPTETAPIAYPTFREGLSHVLIGGNHSRMDPGLLSLLEERTEVMSGEEACLIHLP